MPETTDNQINPIVRQNEGSIVLGKKLEDPYNIKNIKQAYKNLKSIDPQQVPGIDIQPTHLYLRFLPENEEEWGVLKSDSTLVLYDFPLDYEIANMGTYYHDPILPDSAITWQYCVIPVGKSIPGVQHELLYEVYLSNEDQTIAKGSSEMDQFLAELEYESVCLTGNLPESEKMLTGQKNLLLSEWTPKGRIRVWDEIPSSITTYKWVFDHYEYYDCDGGTNPLAKMALPPPSEQCERAVYRYEATTTTSNYRPLVEANVHARWFTHIETCLTDDNGYFQTSSFRFEVNYAIKWQRHDFEIRNGRFFQAWYNGPKQRGDWNLDISSGMSRMYAIIHRAARDYYYNNPFGIQSPPLNKWYNNILSIGAFDWEDVSYNGDTAPWRRWSRTACDLYATTIHELAHASHWDLGSRFKFYIADDIVCESWARVVQWGFTRLIYTGYVPQYFGDYTGLVPDLIDGIETYDLVQGYTLLQIEKP